MLYDRFIKKIGIIVSFFYIYFVILYFYFLFFIFYFFLFIFITGLAIRESDMAAWERSTKCSPAPANCMYCPLCLEAVEDTTDAWKDHLVDSCPENKRSSKHR
jgi:hypothetical protein